MDREERAEQEEMVRLYMDALESGTIPKEVPEPKTASSRIIPDHDPETGEITQSALNGSPPGHSSIPPAAAAESAPLSASHPGLADDAGLSTHGDGEKAADGPMPSVVEAPEPPVPPERPVPGPASRHHIDPVVGGVPRPTGQNGEDLHEIPDFLRRATVTEQAPA